MIRVLRWAATAARHQVMTRRRDSRPGTPQTPNSRRTAGSRPDGRARADPLPHAPGQSPDLSAFRDLLTQDLALLLPEVVPAEEMQGVHLITPDGHFDDDLYDLEQEQACSCSGLGEGDARGRRQRRPSRSGDGPGTGLHGFEKTPRSDGLCRRGKALIETPAGPDSKLRQLRLPSGVIDFSGLSPTPPSTTVVVRLPICCWPMKVTIHRSRGVKTGSARCFHRPHTVLGAAYHFPRSLMGGSQPSLIPPRRRRLNRRATPGAFHGCERPDPQPVPVEGHKALTSGVWRWTRFRPSGGCLVTRHWTPGD